MLLTKEVEVNLISQNIPYYEKLGYTIPRCKNKYGRLGVPLGTKLTVNIKDLPLGSGTRVNVKCDACGREYYLQYYDYNKRLKIHNGTLYCQNCFHITQSNENHYNWNPDLTDEDRADRRTQKEYRDFHRAVLQRDKYRCRKCGNKIKLQVHHINGHNWDKENRTNIENGITLCKICHMNFHSIYGKGNNTKSQFDEWINDKTWESNQYFDGEITTEKIKYCIERQEIILDSNKYIKEHDLGYGGFWHCLSSKGTKPHKGLHYVYYDDFLQMSDLDIYNMLTDDTARFNKKVVQLDSNKNIVRIYTNATELGDIFENESSKSSSFVARISSICNHRKRWKTINGYYFEYFGYYCRNISPQSDPIELLEKYYFPFKDI